MAKERRRDVAHRRPKVHFVEGIVRHDAQLKLVMAVAGAAESRPASAAAQPSTAQPSATTLAPATESAASAPSGLLAKPEGLGKPRVHRELAGTKETVDGHKLIAGNRINIENSQRCLQTGSTQACGQGWPIVEDGISVQILPESNVIRTAGSHHHEGAEAEPIGQAAGPADEKAVAGRPSSRSVTLGKVILVHRKAGARAFSKPAARPRSAAGAA